MKCIRISKENHDRLMQLADELSITKKRKVTIGEALLTVYSVSKGNISTVVTQELKNGEGTTMQVSLFLWRRLQSLRMNIKVRSINSVVSTLLKTYEERCQNA